MKNIHPPQAHYDSILKLANQYSEKGFPPVEKWNPDYCGEIDMRIARDGTWFYMGTPIGRMPLVKLFASVLRREEDGQYLLVTPVEKVGIEVEDVPYIAVELDRVEEDGQQVLVVRTNLDDLVKIGSDNPLSFKLDTENNGIAPYCLIRSRLKARFSRPLLYQLADLGGHEETEGENWFGVKSQGVFFPMMRSDELEAGL